MQTDKTARLARELVSLIVAGVLLTACAATVAPETIVPFVTPSSVATPSPSATVATASAGSSTPASVTAEPSMTATLLVCIVAFPSQVGTDHTAVTIRYPGATARQCASYLVQHNPSAWAKAHPPTSAANVPEGKPACERSVRGVAYVVYGTSAATYVCAALK